MLHKGRVLEDDQRVVDLIGGTDFVQSKFFAFAREIEPVPEPVAEQPPVKPLTREEIVSIFMANFHPDLNREIQEV